VVVLVLAKPSPRNIPDDVMVMRQIGYGHR
jgi:hypothetical protein